MLRSIERESTRVSEYMHVRGAEWKTETGTERQNGGKERAGERERHSERETERKRDRVRTRGYIFFLFLSVSLSLIYMEKRWGEERRGCGGWIPVDNSSQRRVTD